MSKILVADDASFMRLMIRQILAREELKDILEAKDGREAVALFEKNKPDITLLDITMPELDGLATLKEILKIDPKAKVVMCSAVAQERIVKEAMLQGAIDFVTKPFRPDELIKTVKKYLA